ncbi:MAG TPA: methylmalonyl-CoA epimerase [Chloroflexota bacterium]|nr:methylmalonyl-CoA epimerase [Chloroflexota bacterium]
MQIRRIAHVSVAVRSLDEALPFYRDVLGLPLRERRPLPDRGLNVAFVGVGESQIELLEPMDPEGTVARFLARRGEGLHHVCFEVPDVDAAIAELAARGVELIDRHAAPGAQGRVAFLHPRAGHGVLIELQETSLAGAPPSEAP